MTLYNLNTTTQWEQICELHVLELAKEYRPDWYRWRLTNNYERAVFLKGDSIYPREFARYMWASHNLIGKSVMEIGCSTGYGSQFLPKDTEYFGVDYDPIIIHVAKEQQWGETRTFACADINEVAIAKQDTIIAFEVIEHLDNGLQLVERLKIVSKRLMITVPHNEPVGFWGEHHKLHGLNESHFPGFEFEYINEAGQISSKPQAIDDKNLCNLMLCKWTND